MSTYSLQIEQRLSHEGELNEIKIKLFRFSNILEFPRHESPLI